MAIKWIVMDMDGTLLNSENEISEETKRVLMECQKLGIKLILASGRSHRRLDRYAKELMMEQYAGYLIEVNGMAMKNVMSGERMIYKRLNREQSKTLFLNFKDQGFEIQGYLDDGIFDYIPASVFELKKKERMARQLDDDHPWTGGPWSLLADTRDGYPNIRYICDWTMFPQELNKFSLLQDPTKIEAIYPQIIEQFSNDYEIVRTCPGLIEINPKGISKGSALQRMMLENNIALDEVLVFGDGENDTDMFSKVQFSIAMGNAADYVKSKAYAVTKSNNEDGIATMIKQYIQFE